MSLSIYTYSNPYEITGEPYWDSIKMAAHFCVSQTMVNGLETVYPELKNGQLSTVEYLTDYMYPTWDDAKLYIEQYAALTDILDNATYKGTEADANRVKQSLNFNKSKMLDGIRLLSEMGISFRNIRLNRLTEEQMFLIAAYKKIIESDYKSLFTLKDSFSEHEIDTIIKEALKKENARKQISVDGVDRDTVVFHGIHQFTPVILNTIEHVAKHKRVVMLFNYQQQYKDIYQTWLDVYSCFDLTIKSQFDNEFRPNTLLSESYKSNMLADSLARLAGGTLIGKPSEIDEVKIIEFDNITEFAAYVAKCYDAAKVRHAEDQRQRKRSPLYYMDEQFYAAENSVNDILRTYFPEQFGERHFLAYPIGQFFVAITNMWDIEKGGINIQDLSDVAKCLYSEALPEKSPGTLITTFNATKNYFTREDTKTLQGIIKLLRKLKKQKKRLERGTLDKDGQLERLGFYDVTQQEISDLIEALDTLDRIAAFFYEDFENKENNFKHFYERIKEFVEQNVMPGAETEQEFQNLIVRLLERLEEIEDVKISSSFDCLKETMSYYLKQQQDKNRSANWIVRDFQQIDGDVLQSIEQIGKVKYHFACISDTDMNVKREDQFPWPLDTAFFENAYEPLDWKYQVFVKSRKEFKHFKRYALIYGLEFNRCDFRISYVKNTDDKENEIYYMLKLLGIEPDRHLHDKEDDKQILPIEIEFEHGRTDYSLMDCYRKKICSYKFALESIVEEETRFRDLFLQKKYYEIVLTNNVRKKLENQIASDSTITNALNEEADRLSNYFQFIIPSEKMDAVSNARAYIYAYVLRNGSEKQFPALTQQDCDRMKKREVFLSLHLEDENKRNVLNGKFETTPAEFRRMLSEDTLKKDRFEKCSDLWCQWCASREVCLEPYMSISDR